MIKIPKISHAAMVDAEGWLIDILIEQPQGAHAHQENMGAYNLKQTSIS
jgi:hypothetical protein